MRLTYVLAAATLWGCSTPPPTAQHTTACWIEYSAGDAPSSLVAPDLPDPVWHTTTSGLLLRRPDGDLLIDAGWNSAAAEQSAELTEEGRSWSLRILSAVAWRRSTPDALAENGVDARDLDWTLPTHAHYDHMAGAQDIPGAPILLTRRELDFLTAQLSVPSIIAPSNIRSGSFRSPSTMARTWAFPRATTFSETAKLLSRHFRATRPEASACSRVFATAAS